MKVTTSFYETSVPFPSETHTQIERLLTGSSAKFIERAQIAAGEYQHLAKAWDCDATPADVRGRIEKLGRLFKSTSEALATLSDSERRFIGEAQALERSSDVALTHLQVNLLRLALACQRAANIGDLNVGSGNTADDARRLFIKRCAEAYQDTTGKTPSTSSTGTFAKVMRLVLKAGGADHGISNDLLQSVLKPVR